VLHATAFVAPPSHRPTLLTIHDCAFALLPETTDGWVRSFEVVIRRALDRGAWIHCSTQAVAGEVEGLFGPGLFDAGRMVVVPFGIPPVPEASGAPPVDGPYVLALGASGPRKNLPRLVEAFARIAGSHAEVSLVLAGPDGADRPAVERAIDALPADVRSRVRLPGLVEGPVRAALLRDAAVLAYPSLYEGFGFPVLEAMQAGVPVLTSRVAALEEVAGGAAELVDPLEADDIAAGLDRMLSDDALRRDRQQRGRERAAGFTWERTAAGLASAYRELAATSS
jgi:glycosyltransferase involved in cell wall biosynthesis